jgi:2-deoxy-D-gluconate 3-dehydrogenase
MNPRFSLAGRRALVTGANAGIGRACALALGAAGAHVVCAGRSAMDDTLADLAALGAGGQALSMDLSDIPAAVAALQAAGDLDILINNAGIIRRADSVDFTESDWDAVMDVNLKAAFFLSQAFAKAVFARGAEGRIVNVASLLSFQGGIRVPSYTASKHGIAGLTKILANEWAAKGVNVNAVAPGYIETANTAPLRADPDRSKAILDRIPAGRWGEPADIGDAAAFLCMPASRYMHGAVVPVDGGWMAR